MSLNPPQPPSPSPPPPRGGLPGSSTGAPGAPTSFPSSAPRSTSWNGGRREFGHGRWERKERRWPTVALVVVLVLAILLVVASRIQLDEYAISPGTAQNVADLITVPPGKAQHQYGTILLTDVLEARLNLLTYLPARLSRDTVIVPASNLSYPGVNLSELDAQGAVDMANSVHAAKAAALARLGYHVGISAGGVQVYATESSSASAAALSVGDVITAVNGTATPTVCDFAGALHPLDPGQTVRLTVQQVTVSSEDTLQYGRSTVVPVTLVPAPKGQPATGCPGLAGPPKALIGVIVLQMYNYTYPFPISIDTEGIGGPSAGLAMTLALMDKLSSGHLAHGVMSATGTIDPLGNVGDVGGVPQKTLAVEAAGATVFIVPTPEYSAAKSKDIPSLHICEVNTLGQALGVLERYGGDVPASLHPVPVRPGTCT